MSWKFCAAPLPGSTSEKQTTHVKIQTQTSEQIYRSQLLYLYPTFRTRLSWYGGTTAVFSVEMRSSTWGTRFYLSQAHGKRIRRLWRACQGSGKKMKVNRLFCNCLSTGPQRTRIASAINVNLYSSAKLIVESGVKSNCPDVCVTTLRPIFSNVGKCFPLPLSDNICSSESVNLWKGG